MNSKNIWFSVLVLISILVLGAYTSSIAISQNVEQSLAGRLAVSVVAHPDHPDRLLLVAYDFKDDGKATLIAYRTEPAIVLDGKVSWSVSESGNVSLVLTADGAEPEIIEAKLWHGILEIPNPATGELKPYVLVGR
ncbi:MAG: hypothetical protein AAFR75_00345 [Pseudomonadota bacterium]